MIRKHTLSTALLGLFAYAFGFAAFAQTSADAVAEVPELVEFHKVIYKIWHDAWPNKNTSMLKDLAPDVENGISNVASARLPGILREKKDAWDKGIANLQIAGADYKTAAESNNADRLLSAAETLHSRFEVLMRLTRPAFKELGDFHSALYSLYHHYLPEWDIEKIRLSAGELKQKMQALNEAATPEALLEKESEFLKARENLSGSVEAFARSLETNRNETIKQAVETLHSYYEALQEICN